MHRMEAWGWPGSGAKWTRQGQTPLKRWLRSLRLSPFKILNWFVFRMQENNGKQSKLRRIEMGGLHWLKCETAFTYPMYVHACGKVGAPPCGYHAGIFCAARCGELLISRTWSFIWTNLCQVFSSHTSECETISGSVIFKIVAECLRWSHDFVRICFIVAVLKCVHQVCFKVAMQPLVRLGSQR